MMLGNTKLKLSECLAGMGRRRKAWLILVLNLKKNYHLEDLGVRQEDIIEMNLKGIKY